MPRFLRSLVPRFCGASSSDCCDDLHSSNKPELKRLHRMQLKALSRSTAQKLPVKTRLIDSDAKRLDGVNGKGGPPDDNQLNRR